MEVSSRLSDEADGRRRGIPGQEEAGAKNETGVTGLRNQGAECKQKTGQLRCPGRAAECSESGPSEVNVVGCTEDDKYRVLEVRIRRGVTGGVCNEGACRAMGGQGRREGRR
jgi:hypothetical protein